MNTVAVYAKAFYKSKVIVLNTLVALATVIVAVSEQIDLAFVRDPRFVTAVAIANIILRFITKRPVATTDQRVDITAFPGRPY